MSGAVALVWLLAAGVSDLSLPYGESARPRLCEVGRTDRAPAPSAGAGTWERVRGEPFEALCLSLARAQIRLAREPKLALERAREMVERWPGRPEPKVLEARALLRTGDGAGSWAAWQAAKALGWGADGASSPEPSNAHVLRDLALAAVAVGETEVAVGTYRRLVSLLDAWPDPRHVQRLYLEAAAASLRGSPAHLDEAQGHVSSALGSAHSTGLAAYATGLEAWITERRGRGAAAPRTLTEAEIRHFVALSRAPEPPSFWPALPKHELAGVASLLVEQLSVSEAAELWESYVRGLRAGSTEPVVLQFAQERRARLGAKRQP